MKHALVYLAVVLAVFLFPAAKGDAPRASEEKHLQGDAHHDEDDHEGDHGDEHGHEGGDTRYSGKIGDYEISIMQHGDIAPHGEAHFDIVLSSHPKAPKAIRLWIGDRSARGSVKSRAGKGHSPGEYHALVEVPDELSEGSKLWVEIQGSGSKKKGAFELK
jgi:hypothetical protein